MANRYSRDCPSQADQEYEPCWHAVATAAEWAEYQSLTTIVATGERYLTDMRSKRRALITKLNNRHYAASMRAADMRGRP